MVMPISLRFRNWLPFVTLFALALPALAEDAKPASEGTWQIASVTVKDHDNKSYSAGKFILFPTKEHHFVVAKFELKVTSPDPKAVEKLASIQKLSDADKKAAEDAATGTQNLFDMSKLTVVDATGKSYAALWNTDETITTELTVTSGTTTTPGRDPANWVRTRRRAVKLSKDAREKLIKEKQIDASHPDYRTWFTGLLEVDKPVKVTFVFQVPDTVKKDQLQVRYGVEAAVSADGQAVAKTGGKQGPNTSAPGALKAVSSEPNWSVEDITWTPFTGASYTKDKVTINPVDGKALVQVSFKLTALQGDSKAIDVYSRMWSNVDKKFIQSRATGGVRVFENRNLALVDPAGARYVCLWNPDSAVRTHVYTASVSPSSTSQTRVSNWSGRPHEFWIDAEQSFITRSIHPANQPAIVEHVTLFSGLLPLQRAINLTFLFSVPTNVDRQTLRLMLDSETFPINARVAAAP